VENKFAINPNEFIISLKGKPYMPALPRVAWMRMEHADWGISTEILEWNKEQKWIVVKATITDESGKLISTGIKSQASARFLDYIEKAETGAISRALAFAGYGTLQAADMNDEDNIVNKMKDNVELPKMDMTEPF
jgi:hypothetical protein